MDSLANLKRCGADFERRLRLVAPEQWELATPCDGWDVQDLVAHVISANRMGIQLLGGCSREEATALIRRGATDGDLVTAYIQSAEDQLEAFGQPGAMEMTVHHPMGDITGRQLLDFRLGDILVHTWDLSRAIGVDDSLDAASVAEVWASLEPVAALIPSIGVFGEGPSGDVGEDAPIQVRLIDLTGRRP